MPAKKVAKKPARKPRAKAAPEPGLALKQEAEAANILPLDYMLQVLNAPEPVPVPREPIERYLDRVATWEARRMDAAKAAAPYIHAKPAAVVKIDTPIVEAQPVNVLELAKSVAFLFTLAQARPEVDVTPIKLN